MDKVGYARRWPSGPKNQVETLRTAGCDPIYEDKPRSRDEPLSQRDYAIKALRPGRQLVVVEASVLGRNADEITDGLQAVYEQTDGGAEIMDLSTGEACVWSEDAQKPLRFLAHALARLGQRKGHAGQQAAKGKTGRKPAFAGPQIPKAKADWHSGRAPQAEIAADWGVSVKTMHKWFGPAGGGSDE